MTRGKEEEEGKKKLTSVAKIKAEFSYKKRENIIIYFPFLRTTRLVDSSGG